MLDRKTLRMAEAAEVLGVSRSQLYVLAKRGDVPVVRIGSSLRVPAAALDRWLEDRTRGGQSAA